MRCILAAAAHPDGTYERQAKETEEAFRDNHHAHKPSPSYRALTRSKLRSIKLMTRVYVRTRGLFSRGAKLALPSSGSVEVSIYAWDGQTDAVEVVGRVSCRAWVWMDARETGFVEGGVLTRKPRSIFSPTVVTIIELIAPPFLVLPPFPTPPTYFYLFFRPDRKTHESKETAKKYDGTIFRLGAGLLFSFSHVLTKALHGPDLLGQHCQHTARPPTNTNTMENHHCAPTHFFSPNYTTLSCHPLFFL
jgi:hypothetical protein